MAINERLIHTAEEAAAGDNGGAGTGNQEEGLILHLDANDVDSYDGDGSVWYDITNHEYTPAVNPSEHFNAVTYTGNGTSNTTEQSITGVGFQPDLVWIKNRGESRNHVLVDSLRKTGNLLDELHSNTTDAANTTGTDNVKTMDSDGFTVLGQGSETNDSGDTFVAWCFKAGGAPTATNTATSGAMTANSVSIDGTLESAYTPTDATIYPKKISANTKLGFSTVLFEGTGNSNNRVPHGLDVPPELIIYKNIDEDRSWVVGSDGIGWTNTMKLEDTSAAADRAYFDDVAPTANVFEIYNGQANTANDDGSDFIAYCFASKRGVSKVGSYTGTGGAGNKVYTGFQPAFVMMKNTSTNGYSWHIVDNKRNYKALYPDLNNIEGDLSAYIEFNEDGFTHLQGSNSLNKNGNKFIYLAFAAEKPDSLIDDTDLELHLDPASYSGSGTTWTADTGNDGTLVGNTSYDEELGDFFDLDGSGDYISLNTSGYLDGDFTLEMWWNFDTLSGYKMLWGGQDYGGGGTGGLAHYIEDNKIKTWVSNSSGTAVNVMTSGSVLSTNKWQHIVITRSGSSLAAYVDGESVATGTYSGSLSSANTKIGASYSNSLYDVNGRVGQVRVYDSGLSADEVMQNYRFTKNDYPNGFNGTLSAATWNSLGFFNVTGSSNSGVEIDGLTTQITPNGNDSTMGGWFRKDNTNLATFWSKGTNTNYELQALEGNGNALMYIFYRRSGSQVANAISNSTLSVNTWYHIMGVIDWYNQDVKIYLNGSLVGTNTTWSHITSNQHLTGSIFLGRRNDNSGNLDGKVSEFKVYDKVLTSTEITAIFDENKANYGY